MYSKKPGLIIGFHGSDESIRNLLVSDKTSFRKSENAYDWLGHGMYFWDNDPDRALEFARFKKDHPLQGKAPIKNPAIIGAVLNLGYCLDLINSRSLQLLKVSYEILLQEIEKSGYEIPKNKPLKGGRDLVFRHLDCAVIETFH